jgi:hypothetical protein
MVTAFMVPGAVERGAIVRGLLQLVAVSTAVAASACTDPACHGCRTFEVAKAKP